MSNEFKWPIKARIAVLAPEQVLMLDHSIREFLGGAVGKLLAAAIVDAVEVADTEIHYAVGLSNEAVRLSAARAQGRLDVLETLGGTDLGLLDFAAEIVTAAHTPRSE